MNLLERIYSSISRIFKSIGVKRLGTSKTNDIVEEIDNIQKTEEDGSTFETTLEEKSNFETISESRRTFEIWEELLKKDKSYLSQMPEKIIDSENIEKYKELAYSIISEVYGKNVEKIISKFPRYMLTPEVIDFAAQKYLKAVFTLPQDFILENEEQYKKILNSDVYKQLNYKEKKEIFKYIPEDIMKEPEIFKNVVIEDNIYGEYSEEFKDSTFRNTQYMVQMINWCVEEQRIDEIYEILNKYPELGNIEICNILQNIDISQVPEENRLRLSGLQITIKKMDTLTYDEKCNIIQKLIDSNDKSKEMWEYRKISDVEEYMDGYSLQYYKLENSEEFEEWKKANFTDETEYNKFRKELYKKDIALRANEMIFKELKEEWKKELFDKYMDAELFQEYLQKMDIDNSAVEHAFKSEEYLDIYLATVEEKIDKKGTIDFENLYFLKEYINNFDDLNKDKQKTINKFIKWYYTTIKDKEIDVHLKEIERFDLQDEAFRKIYSPEELAEVSQIRENLIEEYYIKNPDSIKWLSEDLEDGDIEQYNKLLNLYKSNIEKLKERNFDEYLREVSINFPLKKIPKELDRDIEAKNYIEWYKTQIDSLTIEQKAIAFSHCTAPYILKYDMEWYQNLAEEVLKYDPEKARYVIFINANGKFDFPNKEEYLQWCDEKKKQAILDKPELIRHFYWIHPDMKKEDMEFMREKVKGNPSLVIALSKDWLVNSRDQNKEFVEELLLEALKSADEETISKIIDNINEPYFAKELSDHIDVKTIFSLDAKTLSKIDIKDLTKIVCYSGMHLKENSEEENQKIISKIIETIDEKQEIVLSNRYRTDLIYMLKNIYQNFPTEELKNNADEMIVRMIPKLKEIGGEIEDLSNFIHRELSKDVQDNALREIAKVLEKMDRNSIKLSFSAYDSNPYVMSQYFRLLDEKWGYNSQVEKCIKEHGIDDDNLGIILDGVVKNEKFAKDILGTFLKNIPEDSLYCKKIINLTFKDYLDEINQETLSDKEIEIFQEIFKNNNNACKTVDPRMLKQEIVDLVGRERLGRLTRYEDTQNHIIESAKDDTTFKTMGSVLKVVNGKVGYIEPYVELFAKQINEYDRDNSELLGDIVSYIEEQEIQGNDVNLQRAKLFFVMQNTSNINIESLDEFINLDSNLLNKYNELLEDENATIRELQGAHLFMNYGLTNGSLKFLSKTYGKDLDRLLETYPLDSEGVILDENLSVEELEEIEAIKRLKELQNFSNETDVRVLRKQIQAGKENNPISEEDKYMTFFVLENSLKRAYCRADIKKMSEPVQEIVEVIKFGDKQDDLSIIDDDEKELLGKQITVRKIKGPFSRFMTVNDGYRTVGQPEKMYERWQSKDRAETHALCISAISQSSYGTAPMFYDNGNNKVSYIFKDMPVDALTKSAPYDLVSDSTDNKTTAHRKSMYLTMQTMSDFTRHTHNEAVMEIQDIRKSEYEKIQPSEILCFENTNANSRKAALKFGIDIEVVDRRELAKDEQKNIEDDIKEFEQTLEPSRIGNVINRFLSNRSGLRILKHSNSEYEKKLYNELLGEGKEYKGQTFHKERLEEYLEKIMGRIEKECLEGDKNKAKKAIESFGIALKEESEKYDLIEDFSWRKNTLCIDENVYMSRLRLMEVEHLYRENPLAKRDTNISNLSVVQSLENNSCSQSLENKSTSYIQSASQDIVENINISEVQKQIQEMRATGLYNDFYNHDEKHIENVILFASTIGNIEGLSKTEKDLLMQAATFYKSGKVGEKTENYGTNSAKIANHLLSDKYDSNELKKITFAIEYQEIKDNMDLRQLDELCEKIFEEKTDAEQAKKIALCLEDANNLDMTRFSIMKNPRLLHTEAAQGMVDFSYCLNEKLAQKELDKMVSDKICRQEEIDEVKSEKTPIDILSIMQKKYKFEIDAKRRNDSYDKRSTIENVVALGLEQERGEDIVI